MRFPSFYTRAIAALVLLTPASALAMPVIGINSPAAGAVADSVPVAASVNSPYVITSVVATIGTVSLDLLAAGNPPYSGTLDITALPLGPVTLSITASDANGSRRRSHGRSRTIVRSRSR